jgi:cytochrome c peroxidase
MSAAGDAMKFRTSLAFFTTLTLLALPFTLIAADGTETLAALKMRYRRTAKIPYPENNPYSKAKAELGKTLFFDPIMSGSKKISCATCHKPNLAWGDGLPHAIGADPKGLLIRSPTLVDVAFSEPLGWDGKFADIESVTFSPITSPSNMNMPEDQLIGRLQAIPGYQHAFKRAFGDKKIDRERVEMALATYERTIVAGRASFDRWIMGDNHAISAQAKRGFVIFNGKAHCADCHSGPSFTDGSFQDIGIGVGEDIGRAKFFKNSEKLRYAFKTPTLRDVAKRAPYMHDGSIPTLEAVIDHYNKGGIDRPSRSPSIKPLFLTKDEKADLIAFLKTLTGTSPPVKLPVLPR